MNIIHVASEVTPWSQTGGLADVVHALPAAHAQWCGSTVAVCTPLYRSTRTRLAAAGRVLQPGPTITLPPGALADAAGSTGARLVCLADPTVARQAPGAASPLAAPATPLTLWFVDCPALFDRDGLYGPTSTSEYDDNHLRFAVLGWGAWQLAQAMASAADGNVVDVLHAHDWQGALALAIARQHDTRHLIRARLLTIHNLAFRGLITAAQYAQLGLPEAWFHFQQFEFWGKASLLKGGIASAHAITTVSPRYAEEILTPEFGEALDGFLRFDAPRLVGIVNGIDTESWDPARDDALAAPYRANDLAGKRICRDALVAECGMPAHPDDMILAVVSRLTSQKGIDWLADIVPHLASLDMRVVILGTGAPELEDRLRYLAKVFSHHVALHIGFDAHRARRIYAGADAFVMPSRFEPCGLGQLYAMRYGTLPIVRPVGGLRDTVPTAPGCADACGFAVPTPDAAGLLHALHEARQTWRSPRWTQMQQAAMTRPVDWLGPAHAYDALYRSLP